MINEVRNTVMAVLNKDNNGYITPTEFNLFAKQAQLELFEEYFYDYNNWLIKQNQGNGREIRLSNSGYADIPKSYAQVIDSLSQTFTVVTAAANVFTLPTDWYLVNVVNYTDQVTGDTAEVERVEHNKILLLNNSVLTAPSKAYPAYVLNGATSSAVGNTITIYPSTITTAGDVTIHYVRYPLTPNWTYTGIGADGDPIFDQSNTDYQDFELPLSDSTTLVFKILQYAGVNIREAEVTTFGQTEETTEDKIES